MASSMPTGDRRWTPTRKSGMTVLGKVPKPINLPSQRLENHGLDPNVEIVPKGTPSWGSRPSSAGTNAWGTSSLSSPHADGSAGSPSFVCGRPSSGGSGTRPSTAGSDRSHEPVSNAWGPNSRPSSASGILALSQLSAAASRPRSAETRPCSSQLSRFAESSVDNAVAWGPTGTAERLGTVSSKTSGFTLSSGDFPTLGSEKNSDSHSQRGHSSQGRPTSASGTVSTPKEILEGNRNTDHLDGGNVNTWKAENHSDGGNVNTWKAENHPYVGDAASPVWHKDPKQAQSYANVNMPPRQFDSWPNSPFHPSDGSWYRGGPPVGPYRPPGPPGGYFDYPHVSARPLPNTQAGPRPEGGSVGYRPNSGEPCHPHMPPEPFMGPGHSNMPLRPGPYPGPVPYDGYYGPPQAGFYNINEKGPVMPMVRPVVYHQYPPQNPNLDPGRYHARPGGYISATNVELMKSDQSHESQGQLRVLFKQHDSREDCGQGKGEQSIMGNAPHLERGKQPGLLRQEGDLQTKNQKPEPAEPVSLSSGEAAPSLHTSDLDSHSGTYVKNSLEDSRKAADDGLIRREEATNVRVRDRRQYPAMKKNSTLMEKGEDLNIKARVTDGRNELGVHSLKGRTKAKNVTSISDQSTSMVVNASTSNEAILVPDKRNVRTEEKNCEPSSDEKVLHAPSNPVGAGENAHFQAQKRGHGFKGVDPRAKSKSIRHENDDWTKKSPESEPSVTTIGVSGKGGPGASPLECATSLEALENHGVLHATSAGDGSFLSSSLDKAQRAKLKEIAMQRAKQLEEEEEERTREQKAKALAKLEELNRRTLAESSNQKLSRPPPTSSDVANKNDDSGASASPKTDMNFVQVPGGNLTCDSKAVSLADDDAMRNIGVSSDVSSDVLAQASDSAIQSPNMLQNQSLAPKQETISKKNIHTTALDSHDTSSKHKQLGYRRRQSMPQDKSMGEKQITPVSTEVPKNTGEVGISTVTSDILANNDDNSVHHRKRNSKGARHNKNKLDDVLPSFPSPDTEGSSGKVHTESTKDSPSGSVVEAISVPYESSHETVVIQSSREVPVIPLNQGSSESNEESHARVSNHSKPHPQRKFTKNKQANKPVPKYHGGSESVIWAVKPPNKIEPSEEVSKDIVTETTYLSVKGGHGMQSGIKTKRAEMERYVPKPVAKELSQQVNAPRSSPSTQAGPGEMTGKPDSLLTTVEHGRDNEVPVGKANFASDIRNGENIKHHGKISASWHQRSFAESPPLEGSLSFNSVKTVLKASDQLQPSMVDSLPKGKLTHIDDGWNDNNDSLHPLASVTSTAVVKNVGVNRQRRQPGKVQRVPGSTYATSDNMDVHRGMADKREIESPDTGLNDSSGGKIVSTESQNANAEHTRSHWQPKSQAYSYHGRQGNKSNVGGQSVSVQGTEHNVVQNEHKNTLNPNSFAAEARDPRHQGGKREAKVVADLSKENMTVDFAADVNPQHQQSATFGDNQQGHYGNRFQRGQDSGYRGKAMGQDDGRRNFYKNGDKQKDSYHLEFQHGNYHKPGEPYQQNPVYGSAHEGSRASGSKYRERAHHHSRGGHLYGRSRDPARVSTYNSGE